MANYGQAIGSVVGATLVVDAMGGMYKKSKKLKLTPSKKKKRK
jgi:hypothetical protein